MRDASREQPRRQRARLEVGIDCPEPDALAPFWLAALGYERAEGDGKPYLNLLPGDDERPIVFLQRTDDRKHGKNHVHLDVYVDDPVALVDELLRMGARAAGEPELEDGRWSYQVLVDPAGNEFCVCAETGDDGRPVLAVEDYR